MDLATDSALVTIQRCYHAGLLHSFALLKRADKQRPSFELHGSPLGYTFSANLFFKFKLRKELRQKPMKTWILSGPTVVITNDNFIYTYTGQPGCTDATCTSFDIESVNSYLSPISCFKSDGQILVFLTNRSISDSGDQVLLVKSATEDWTVRRFPILLPREYAPIVTSVRIDGLLEDACNTCVYICTSLKQFVKIVNYRIIDCLDIGCSDVTDIELYQNPLTETYAILKSDMEYIIVSVDKFEVVRTLNNVAHFWIGDVMGIFTNQLVFSFDDQFQEFWMVDFDAVSVHSGTEAAPLDDTAEGIQSVCDAIAAEYQRCTLKITDTERALADKAGYIRDIMDTFRANSLITSDAKPYDYVDRTPMFDTLSDEATVVRAKSVPVFPVSPVTARETWYRWDGSRLAIGATLHNNSKRSLQNLRLCIQSNIKGMPLQTSAAPKFADVPDISSIPALSETPTSCVLRHPYTLESHKQVDVVSVATIPDELPPHQDMLSVTLLCQWTRTERTHAVTIGTVDVCFASLHSNRIMLCDKACDVIRNTSRDLLALHGLCHYDVIRLESDYTDLHRCEEWLLSMGYTYCQRLRLYTSAPLFSCDVTLVHVQYHYSNKATLYLLYSAEIHKRSFEQRFNAKLPCDVTRSLTPSASVDHNSSLHTCIQREIRQRRTAIESLLQSAGSSPLEDNDDVIVLDDDQPLTAEQREFRAQQTRFQQQHRAGEVEVTEEQLRALSGEVYSSMLQTNQALGASDRR